MCTSGCVFHFGGYNRAEYMNVCVYWVTRAYFWLLGHSFSAATEEVCGGG